MDGTDPAEAFAQLGQIKLGETDLGGVLDVVAHLARRTVPGTHAVSVTLIRNGKPFTAAFTGEPALQLDESQYGVGQGPCLDAAATTGTLLVPDMTTEGRWPRWPSDAMRHGVLSSLAIGLAIEEDVTGALNLYATRPGGFDDAAVKLAETFAEYAAVALSNAHRYDTTVTLAQQMQAAMANRAVIEQAKGIIMGERHCTPDEAFDFLRQVSQDSNRKLRDIAEVLVRQAAEPRR